MRNFYRERRMVWYILLIESVISLYAIRRIYHAPTARFTVEVCVFLLGLIMTYLMISRLSSRCSDFAQGAITISYGMAVYLCYSLESGSDRLLPVCILFVLAECAIYKNIQLKAKK